MISFLFFTFFGSIFGFLLGLVPGTHVNNLLPFIISLSVLFPSPLHLSIFIASFSVSQLVSSFLPSIFLGAPNPDTSLSVLPAHKMLLMGKGKEALLLMLTSSVTSSLLSFSLISVFSNSFKEIYLITRPYVHFLILFVIALMLFYEKSWKKRILSLSILLLSGIFGLIALNSPLSGENTLFPMLSGMFGLSTVLMSIAEESVIPKQEEGDFCISLKKFLISTLIGCLAGIVVGFLPAIGVSQAILLIQQIGRINDLKSFLISLASVNVANEVFSLNSLYLLDNPRSGSSIAIQKLLGEVNLTSNLLLTSSILLSASISSFLTFLISKKIVELLERCDYRKLNGIVSFMILSSVFFFTRFFGIFILLISTSIGILCNLLGVKRSYCMGSLLIPSILFFSGYQPTILEFIAI